jgi:hypothetical protein
MPGSCWCYLPAIVKPGLFVLKGSRELWCGEGAQADTGSNGENACAAKGNMGHDILRKNEVLLFCGSDISPLGILVAIPLYDKTKERREPLQSAPLLCL